MADMGRGAKGLAALGILPMSGAQPRDGRA